jgi:hypothetical protein
LTRANAEKPYAGDTATKKVLKKKKNCRDPTTGTEALQKKIAYLKNKNQVFKKPNEEDSPCKNQGAMKQIQ